jgi:GNAT superfamily N-acetyltransferase
VYGRQRLSATSRPRLPGTSSAPTWPIAGAELARTGHGRRRGAADTIGALMLTVGRLQPEDRPVWVELFGGYNAFYERVMTDEIADRAWAEFQRDDRMHALGAKLDGRLVGISHFLVHASTTTPDVCYLQDLFTAPDVRGQGIGAALIEAVVGWARDRGCARVYWMTHETNARARRLYDHVGENRGFIRYEIEL